jgi:hypothetical protein
MREVKLPAEVHTYAAIELVGKVPYLEIDWTMP